MNAIGRMDAVIHNAGAYSTNGRTPTPEGHPTIMAVNILAPYILTALMERPRRLVYLSSGMHRGGTSSLRETRSPPDSNEILRVIFIKLFGRLLDQQRCELHRFDAHTAPRFDALRHRLQTLESSGCQRDQPSFGPLGIRRPPSANRHAEARLDLRQQLHRSEVAAAGRDFALALGTKPPSNLVHIKAWFHLLLRAEFTNREILVADYHAGLSLARFPTHRPAETQGVLASDRIAAERAPAVRASVRKRTAASTVPDRTNAALEGATGSQSTRVLLRGG